MHGYREPKAPWFLHISVVYHDVSGGSLIAIVRNRISDENVGFHVSEDSDRLSEWSAQNGMLIKKIDSRYGLGAVIAELHRQGTEEL